MAIYYIDPINGDNRNSGLSKKEALADNKKLQLSPGDTVLFKRGTFIRGHMNNKSGSEGNPITYGAYGEGKKPVFCGSVDLMNESLWTEEEENIWVCTLSDEAGNIIYNNTNLFGTLRWQKEDLTEQGDFALQNGDKYVIFFK